MELQFACFNTEFGRLASKLWDAVKTETESLKARAENAERVAAEIAQECERLRAEKAQAWADREQIQLRLEERQAVESDLQDCRDLMRRTARGGSVVSAESLKPAGVAMARATQRLWVDRDGLGFAYLPGPIGLVSENECQVDLDALRTALSRYGQHLPECALARGTLGSAECTCGLTAAMEGR